MTTQQETQEMQQQQETQQQQQHQHPSSPLETTTSTMNMATATATATAIATPPTATEDLHRPPCPVTEAQLRWAQFHQKNTARQVKSQVEALLQTPALPSQVDGAQSEDGYSTASSSAALSQSHRRVVISRGRRALLKVSKRNYEQRKALDAAEQQQQSENGDDEDDALAAIFAEETVGTTRRRRQRRRQRQQRQQQPGNSNNSCGNNNSCNNNNNTPVMTTQFESAFRAMMMTLATQRQDTPQIQIPTRRWTRPEGAPVDTNYMLVRPAANMEHPHVHFGSTPIDRGASWLVHVPKATTTTCKKNNHRLSQTKEETFEEALQEDQDDDDSPRKDFLERRRLFEETTTSTTPPTQDETTTTAIPIPQDAMGFVQQFVAQIEQAAAAEELVSADGKLHKATFAKLIRRYLQPATSSSSSASKTEGFQSPLALARARRNAGTLNQRHTQQQQQQHAPPLPSNSFLRHFMEQMETAVDQEESLVTDQGKLDTAVFEQLVTQYLAQAADQSLNEHEQQQQQQEEDLEQQQRDDQEEEDDASSFASRPSMAARWAGSVTNRMSGFMKRLNNTAPLEDGDDDDDNNSDRQAVAAFRKHRADLPPDDNSSLSSFRALPTGLMKVVKNFRKGPQNSLEEDEHGINEDGEHDESYAELSPERLQDLHERLMVSDGQSIIDTDDVGGGYTNPANLLLSPTLLTKRHQQAVRAVEGRHWDQVSYLLSANPWLAEMTDVKSGQYLLHSLAAAGSAPPQINTDLIRMHPNAVHKFDQDGNLPLHLAAASGNLPMITLLGDRFASGASVRNEDGMLPLHLAIWASGTAAEVRALLSYFPAAVGVTDNEGNLPLHAAASVLSEEEGAEVVYLLLDEATRQAPTSSLSHKVLEDLESVDTESTTATDSSNHGNSGSNTDRLMAKNDRGETPLFMAIRAHAGWQIIEALASVKGAALQCDADQNNALHRLVQNENKDPDSILSVLKVAPETAAGRNVEGMLPIEMACLQMLPHDVILEIALADLPIDIECRHDIQILEGRGASWWYLTCECDDFFVEVVEELVSLCTFAQAQAICSVQKGEDTLLERATPYCHSVLQAALLFAGRFELDDAARVVEAGIKVYDALDFGTPEDAYVEGRKVVLTCYAQRETFENEISVLHDDMDFSMLEEVVTFSVSGEYWSVPLDEGEEHCFVSVEQPRLTLGGVLKGMLGSEECQSNTAVRQRYTMKVLSVLRIVAKAIHHLYCLKLVHGKINLENCCKYDDGNWKISDALGCQRIGEPIRVSRLSSSSPPECFEPLDYNTSKHQAVFKSDYVCTSSMDRWAFGKLAYEVLVGRDLIALDENARFEDDHRAMMDLMHWNTFNCEEVRQELLQVGVPEDGAELISRCLAPHPDDRPTSLEILHDKVWKELRKPMEKAV